MTVPVELFDMNIFTCKLESDDTISVAPNPIPAENFRIAGCDEGIGIILSLRNSGFGFFVKREDRETFVRMIDDAFDIGD